MEESKKLLILKLKLLIMRILVIIGVICILFGGIIELTSYAITGRIYLSSLINGIVFTAIAVLLIIMCIKPNEPIPFKGLLLLILGIVIIVIGIVLWMMRPVIFGGILVAIAGILDLVIKVSGSPLTPSRESS